MMMIYIHFQHTFDSTGLQSGLSHDKVSPLGQQAKKGTTLSFLEECQPGDLAFFDNAEGAITHVGIVLDDFHIIHASGRVRVDGLDHSGIYNAELGRHTHKLRVLKRIID